MKAMSNDLVIQYRDLLAHMEDVFQTHNRKFIAYLLRVAIKAVDEEFRLVSGARTSDKQKGRKSN